MPGIHEITPRTAADDPLFADLAALLEKRTANGAFGFLHNNP
jgi:hypothetical protein